MECHIYRCPVTSALVNDVVLVGEKEWTPNMLHLDAMQPLLTHYSTIPNLHTIKMVITDTIISY